MLSQKDIDRHKTSLIGEKVRLEKRIAQLSEFPDYGRNEDDNAKELADFENNIGLEEQIKTLLDKVNLALSAINDGNYGICMKCHGAIEPGRLEIMPYVQFCATCQREQKI